MPKVQLSSGKEFFIEETSSILSAAINANIKIPYSCKTGRCNTCKSKLISGVTQAISEEIGLTQSEVDEGWILSCVRKAETDIVLEVEDLDNIDIPKAVTLPCRISGVDYIGKDVVKIKLRLPPKSNFKYLPGQYIDIIGIKGVRRSYSLANTGADNLLELHIRSVDGGVLSDYWFNSAKENDLLRLNGPLGTFFLRDIEGKDLIFLATGTGIAPIKAMLEDLEATQKIDQAKSVTVFWGGRCEQDLYFDVQKISNKFKYIPVLSRSKEDWVGQKGYVQDVATELMPNLENAVVYACGSEKMIFSAKKKFLKSGLDEKKFYSDAFVSA